MDLQKTALANEDDAVKSLVAEFRPPSRRGGGTRPFIAFLHTALDITTREHVKRIFVLSLEGGGIEKEKIDFYHMEKKMPIVAWWLPERSLKNKDGVPYVENFRGEDPYSWVKGYVENLCKVQDRLVDVKDLERLREQAANASSLAERVKALEAEKELTKNGSGSNRKDASGAKGEARP